MATLLVSYDVEKLDSCAETQEFLRIAPKIHRMLEIPCTFFVCGRALENNLKDFQKIRTKYSDLIDLQQHTYSHILLKTLVQDIQEPVMEPDKGDFLYDRGIHVLPGAKLEQIQAEIQKTNDLFKNLLDIECIGLTCPVGYYRGLSDRVDILGVLHELGIRFTISWLRNEKDWIPIPMELQPFWYDQQGFPDMLEFPRRAGDVLKRRILGWKNLNLYIKCIRSDLDYAAEHDLVYSYAQHDWTSLKEDPKMSIITNLLEYAKKKMEIISHREYYQRELNKKLQNNPNCIKVVQVKKGQRQCKIE